MVWTRRSFKETESKNSDRDCSRCFEDKFLEQRAYKSEGQPGVIERGEHAAGGGLRRHSSETGPGGSGGNALRSLFCKFRCKTKRSGLFRVTKRMLNSPPPKTAQEQTNPEAKIFKWPGKAIARPVGNYS